MSRGYVSTFAVLDSVDRGLGGEEENEVEVTDERRLSDSTLDMEEDEEDGQGRRSLSSVSKWTRTLVRLAWKHAAKHKIMFGLAVMTMLLLIFVMTFFVGVTTFAPAIVSRLVETEVGQTDLVLTNRRSAGPFAGSFDTQFLNFSAATPLWDAIDFQTYAARYKFASTVKVQGSSSRWRAKAFAFDTEQENLAGIGVWKHPPVPPGGCFISNSLAAATSTGVGDTIVATINAGSLIEAVTGEREGVQTVQMTLVIHKVISDFGGKFGKSAAEQVGLMIDLDYLETVMRNIDLVNISSLSEGDRVKFANLNIREFSTHLYLQIPPPRNDYLNADYKVVRKQVMDVLRPPVYEVDFREIRAELPILTSLSSYNFLSLFLGLLVNVALAIFIILAWVILYSLFSYSVDTRNYEVGVLRVVGMGKVGIVELVFAQVLLVSVPSWFLGIFLAQGLYSGAVIVLRGAMGISGSLLLPPSAFLIGSILGLLIPLIAAILPIWRAVSNSPSEAFSKLQNRNSAVQVTIRRESARIPPGVLFVSIIAVVLGFSLYYLFPLALITLNATLLLFIFMLLLVSMLLGFCLLFMNLDRVFMLFAFYVGYFWETATVKRLVQTNFVAHRNRNRKTFLMYNLTIALIIYLDVISRSQIAILESNYEKIAGSNYAIVAQNDDRFVCCREELENFVAADPAVASFTWLTDPLSKEIGVDSTVRNIGKSFKQTVRLQAVMPGYEDTSFNRYIRLDNIISSTAGLGWSEFLYSVPGSQSLAIQTKVFDELGLEDDSNLLFDCGTSPRQPFSRLKPALVFSSLSGFKENKLSSIQPALVSFPSYLRLSCGGVNSMKALPLRALLIRIVENLSSEELQRFDVALTRSVASASAGFELVTIEDDMRQIRVVSNILQLAFILVNALAMVICCFSLITSMYANQYEQACELATLRALGFSSFGLFRVGFAEASCLLFTSSILGVLSGWLVALTQSIQNGYFVDLPVTLIIPWTAIVLVFVLSLLSACAGATVVCLKGRHDVASTLRRVN